MVTCLLSCYDLFVRIHSCFASLAINDVHNCLNTCLYALWSTLILNFMHSISFFSQFVFDKFIVKGEEYGYKVGRTLANRVDERRSMINNYLRGRTCIESVRGSWFQGMLILSFSFSFELFLLFWVFLSSSLTFCLTLPFFVPFVGSCGFPSSRWPF
jgi:hypothetical protein